MGHSHGEHVHLEVGQRARTLLIGFLVVVGVLAVAGMIWLLTRLRIFEAVKLGEAV